MTINTDFVVYCLAKHGDGRKPKPMNSGAVYFDPSYIQACVQRAVRSGQLNVRTQVIAEKVFGFDI